MSAARAATCRGLVAPLVATLVSLASPACGDDPRAPFDLDAIGEPDEDCVAVVHEALELGVEQLHRYVADAPGSAGGWALVTTINELDNPELALVRVPAAADEPALAPIGLGIASLTATRVELRAGAAPGELWVLQDAGAAASLRKLAPKLGLVAGNGSLANFPIPGDGGGCLGDHRRELLLIEGRPYVFALPKCSDSEALDLQLLELDPEDLQFASSWTLSFNPCADDPQCASYPYVINSIRGGGSTQVADAERVAVGFSQVREFSVGLTSADVSLLELRLVAGEPNARLITFRQVWLTPTELGLVEFAQDPFAIQLFVRNGGSETDAALLRFDAIGELYVQINSAPLLPLGGRGRLVQFATQSAMLDVRAGALELVPLIDVASWPQWDPRIVYALDDLVEFEPAGIGTLLLRRESAPPQVIALRCFDEG